MRQIILAFILFIAVNAHSQADFCDCHKYYFKAEKAYFSNNQDSTVYYYKKAFSNPEFDDVAKIFNAADKVIRIGELEYAENLIYSARKSGTSIDGIYDFVKRHSKFEFMIDSSKLAEIEVDTPNPDAFLVKELKFMQARDQMIRNEYRNKYDFDYRKLVDYGNFLMLKNILERYNGSFPELNIIGNEGEEYIETILHHFDIQWIAEIFPALVDAIMNKGYMFNEILLYQIDRTIVAGGRVYVYDPEVGSIVPGPKNATIGDSRQFYQHYGGFDLYDSKSKRLVWWSFQKDADKEQVNALREKLCLDSLEDYMSRRPYIEKISDEEFIELFDN